MTFIYLIELHVQGAKGLTNIRKDNVVCIIVSLMVGGKHTPEKSFIVVWEKSIPSSDP